MPLRLQKISVHPVSFCVSSDPCGEYCLEGANLRGAAMPDSFERLDRNEGG